MHMGKRVPSRYEYIRLHHPQLISLQGQRYRGKQVADAFGINRLVLYEEGTVGSEAGRMFFQGIFRQAERSVIIEQFQHECCIGRAASQPCSRRNVF